MLTGRSPHVATVGERQDPIVPDIFQAVDPAIKAPVARTFLDAHGVVYQTTA